MRTVPYYVQAISRFRPELIDGYPSSLLILAKVSRKLGIELPRPRAIIVSAETLWPEDRRELEESFRCKVFNQYSASEPSIFWCDCEHGNMHVNPESGITEILTEDGKPAPAGTLGFVVSTAFGNPVMPLIRYKLGDIACWSSRTTCQCGRLMPMISSIEGRTDDILYLPERGFIGRLDPVFKGLKGIIEAQIIQEELNRVKIKLVPAADYNEEVEKKLMENLRAKLGLEVAIELEKVKTIPRGPNGKFNAVISKVKHLYPKF